MDAPVQYVTASDGYSIAYTVTGAGRPMIFFPPGFMNLELLWRYFPEWMQGLASRFKLICFDARGEGLSTRGLAADHSMADYLRDVEAVIDKFGDARFVFYAVGGRGGHTAVHYSVTNPERVEALVWNIATTNLGAWPSGLFRILPFEKWRLFLESLTPRSATPQEKLEMAEQFSRSVTREDVSAFIASLGGWGFEDEVRRLRMPVLILHPRDYQKVSVEESMKSAAMAQNARFVVIDGDWIYGDATQGLAAIDRFINEGLPSGDARPTAEPDRALAGTLSARECQVLRLLATGRSNQQIADELIISLNTVRRHVSNIFDKTGAANRAQAAVYANEHGLL
jgi:DNA-binding CsgD family transcriptional regulator/pimeloyl-ACP methyl ester carboxylesterase